LRAQKGSLSLSEDDLCEVDRKCIVTRGHQNQRGVDHFGSGDVVATGAFKGCSKKKGNVRPRLVRYEKITTTGVKGRYNSEKQKNAVDWGDNPNERREEWVGHYVGGSNKHAKDKVVGMGSKKN